MADEDDWMEETKEEIALRVQIYKKLDALVEKTTITETVIKRVRFKTKVMSREVSRLPIELWYTRQEYIKMRN